jgi:hypothetical protein
MEKKEQYRILIWLDKEVNGIYNKSNQDLIKNVGNIQLITVTDVKTCMIKIKEIKFKKTIIMVSAKLAQSLFKSFMNDLTDIYIIPKIIVFTSKDTMKKIQTDPKDLIKFPFFKKNLVICQLGVLVNELQKESIYQPKTISKNINAIQGFTFDIVKSLNDLIIPNNFSSLTTLPKNSEIKDFNQFLIDTFSSNTDLKYLIEQTIDYLDIPLEILIKYWLRVYTIEPNFIKEMNKSLNDNKEKNNIYNTYIRVLYSALNKKIIKFYNNSTIFIGTKITKEEINKIQNNINNKKPNLPSCFCYNKAFISTFINDNLIDIFMEKVKLENNEFYSFFEIQKNDLMKAQNIPNVYIKEYSFTGEEEIIFFPFSCFEISSIEKKTNKKNKEYYHIGSIYLGKYEDIIQKQEKKVEEKKEEKKVEVKKEEKKVEVKKEEKKVEVKKKEEKKIPEEKYDLNFGINLIDLN